MEEKLNCYLMLSLGELALRKIAVVLVNRPDFLATTEKIPAREVHSYRRQWIETVGRKIDDTVSKLPLPASVMKEMVPILKAVGSEILKWKMIHKLYLGENDGYFDKKLCWTSDGTVDHRKTAETLVHSDVLDTKQRFGLACLYCLEDCIPALWNEVPCTEKGYWSGRYPSQLGTSSLQLITNHLLIRAAVVFFCGTIRLADSCFLQSAIYGSKTATEYYFQKLLQENRNELLLNIAVNAIEGRNMYGKHGFLAAQENLPDILRYFISVMTKEQQLLLFRHLPCEVLVCFLDWPFQELCLDIADVVWTFLPESKYDGLLFEIKQHIDRTGFYLPNFFQGFFLRSPMNFRKYLLDEECQNAFFFNQFFKAQDSSSIQVILDNIDAVDKERLFFSEKILELFDDALSTERRHIAEDCIRKAKLSKGYWDRLKEAFIEPKIKLKRFFDFLDRMHANTEGKRSTDDEALAAVKTICIA